MFSFVHSFHKYFGVPRTGRKGDGGVTLKRYKCSVLQMKVLEMNGDGYITIWIDLIALSCVLKNG